MSAGAASGHRGKFITFEGGEGTGKTTQIKRLREALEGLGHTVVQTREPGGCPQAENIRELLVTGDPGRWQPDTETLLHFAARNEHLERVIRPALARGDWVISDRFSDSTMAYQGIVQGVGVDKVHALDALVVGETWPDLTLILDLDASLGLERAGNRQDTEDRYEKMGDAFHARLNEAFRAIARDNPERCVLISAEGSIEEVATRVLATVRERLKV